jgi:hypothetical protein
VRCGNPVLTQRRPLRESARRVDLDARRGLIPARLRAGVLAALGRSKLLRIEPVLATMAYCWQRFEDCRERHSDLFETPPGRVGLVCGLGTRRRWRGPRCGFVGAAAACPGCAGGSTDAIPTRHPPISVWPALWRRRTLALRRIRAARWAGNHLLAHGHCKRMRPAPQPASVACNGSPARGGRHHRTRDAWPVNATSPLTRRDPAQLHLVLAWNGRF